MYTNKFGPSLSLLGERLIKIKAFEDIIEKWPEKVFIISSLNIDVERKEELYLLSGRADAGNIDAILMFYAWLFVRANCELQKYNRQDYVATFFPENDPHTGQQVIEEILQELFNPTNDYCILDEKTPPCIEGLHLASNRVLCALHNISSWCKERSDPAHGIIGENKGTIGFCVQQQLEEGGAEGVVQIIRAIPLTFNTLILRAPGGFARIFTICCDCSPKSLRCSKKECSCKFYLRGEKDCSWMCERAEPTGDVFNRERFDARLIDYEDEEFTLGEEGAGDRGGDEGGGEKDECIEGDDGSSSTNN